MNPHERSNNDSQWACVMHPSGAVLKDAVERCQGFSANLREPLRRLEVARGRVVLVIGCGDPLLMASCEPVRPWRRYSSFLVGADHAPLLTEHRGTRLCIDVGLAPWAAGEILGEGVREIGRQPVPLEAFLGRKAERLAESLAQVCTWQARFSLVERFLVQSRKQTRQPARGEIRWAWEMIERTGGRIAVTALSRRLGWSHRHFVACFRAHTGICPKAAARHMRLVRAARMLAREPDMDLGMVASRCEFADQSHFTREFHRLAGCAPGAYRRFLEIGATSPLTRP